MHEYKPLDSLKWMNIVPTYTRVLAPGQSKMDEYRVHLCTNISLWTASYGCPSMYDYKPLDSLKAFYFVAPHQGAQFPSKQMHFLLFSPYRFYT